MFHIAKDCSTGPVIMRGKKAEFYYQLKEGDVVEFRTTKFDDEPSLYLWRGKELLNAPKKRRR